MVKIFNKYVKNSLCNRILIYFLSLFTGIMTVLFLTTNYASEKSFSTAARNSAQRELAATSSAIDTKLTHIFNYAVTVSLNETIINTMEKYPTPPESEALYRNMKIELNSIINSIIGLNSSIKKWDILSVDGTFFEIGGYDIQSVKDFHPDSVIRLHNNNRKTTISGPYLTEGNSILPTDEPQYTFVVSKPIVRLDSLQTCGYVVFFIEDTALSSIFQSYLPDSSDSSFFIINEENRILLSSEKDYINQPFESYYKVSNLDSDEFLLLCQNKYIIASRTDHMELLYTMTTLSDYQWKIINVIPLQALLLEKESFSRTIILCVLLALTTFFLAACLLSRSITRPLISLTQAIRHASENAYETTPIPRASDEIRFLYKGYNHLMLRTQELLNTIYKEQEVKNEYQFRLIQEQIKPHFLYNTLEMIKSMIDLNMNEAASEAITSLSIFYRLSLSRGSDIITLKDELGIAQEYIHLEKLRHMEYFDYTIHYSEEITRYIIPKLSLQPILENAIVHGVNEKGSKGTIRINITEEADTLVFIIEDNGPGIEPEELARLNKQINEPPTVDSTSFGLSNINRRIKMLYGKNYGLTIESQPGIYTKTILTIPKTEMYLS